MLTNKKLQNYIEALYKYCKEETLDNKKKLSNSRDAFSSSYSNNDKIMSEFTKKILIKIEDSHHIEIKEKTKTKQHQENMEEQNRLIARTIKSSNKTHLLVLLKIY